jgi:hypothetical protein
MSMKEIMNNIVKAEMKKISTDTIIAATLLTEGYLYENLPYDVTAEIDSGMPLMKISSQNATFTVRTYNGNIIEVCEVLSTGSRIIYSSLSMQDEINVSSLDSFFSIMNQILEFGR